MTAILPRGGVAGPDKLAYTKSPHYRFFWPCRQDAGGGGPKDKSGQGNNGTLQSSLADATAWSTGGQITTASTGNQLGGFYAAAGVVDWDLSAGQSILIAMELKRAAVAAEREIFGHRNTGEQSLVVKQESTTGKGTLTLRDPANNLFNKGYTNAAVMFDNTWKKVVVWVNGETNRATFRINGVVQSDIDDEPTGLSAPGSLSAYIIGFGFISGAGPNTTDMAFRNIHCLIFDSPPPNIQTLIETLEANPWRPLSAALAP